MANLTAARRNRKTSKAATLSTSGPGVRSNGRVSLTDVLKRAVEFHQSGNLDEAEAAYGMILEAQPKNVDALQFLGVLEHQKGDSEAGIGRLTAALKIDPKNVSCHNNLGSIYNALDDLPKAAQHFGKAVRGKGASAEAWGNLGLVYRRQEKVDDAIDCFRKAIGVAPGYAKAWKELGEIFLKRADYPAAEANLRRYQELEPGDFSSHSNLAFAVQQQGRLVEAEKIFLDILGKSGDSAIGYNLRVVMALQGREDEADALLAQRLEGDSGIWTAELGLAVNLFRTGQSDSAMKIVRSVLDAHSDDAVIWNDVGSVLLDLGRLKEADEILREAIRLDPSLANAHNNLGAVCMKMNLGHEAVIHYKKAAALKPDFIDPYINLTRALRSTKEYDQANLFARAALSLDSYNQMYFPNLAQTFRSTCDFDAMEDLGDVWDNCDQIALRHLPSVFLDLLVHADTDESLGKFFALVRKFGEFVESQAAGGPLPPHERAASRDKLRIGFLSSDLRSHSVSRFLMPLMENYDRDRFEFFCYCPVRDMGDTVQEMIKGYVDKFVFVDGGTDWETAHTIQQDDIDLLFDLNGHTQGTCISSLAYKPAPVQLTWLGYPFTCGLTAIDHVVMDRFVLPEDAKLLVEEPILMPDAWVCFGKFADVGIQPGVPLDREGRVTFGTLNNPYKYTRETIARWARVMQQVPNSRFLLVRPESRSFNMCKNVAEEFRKNGIDPDRLYFFDNRSEKKNHLSYYDEIDVSLDTFPLTGGTTTCEATWMGVPVVSLVGPAFHQRISYSALMQCGLEELCTFDDESFVNRAVELAQDRDKLVSWRHGLRDLMVASPLCDHDRFVHQFQEMLVQVAAHHKLR